MHFSHKKFLTKKNITELPSRYSHQTNQYQGYFRKFTSQSYDQVFLPKLSNTCTFLTHTHTPILHTLAPSLQWRCKFIKSAGQFHRHRHRLAHCRHVSQNNPLSPETFTSFRLWWLQIRKTETGKDWARRWRWDRVWKPPVPRWSSARWRRLVKTRFGLWSMPPVIRWSFSICTLNG